jgi:hypothetical protein
LGVIFASWIDKGGPELDRAFRLIVSFDTVAPYTSSKCAAISPVVKPCALNDNTISSIPVNRRCRFLTICGSNVDSVSRGTWMVTGPISVSTVLARRPLRELLPSRPLDLILLVPQVLVHLGLERRFEHRRRQLVEQPIRAHQLHPVRLGLRQELIRQFPLIDRNRRGHGIHRVRHHDAFPPSSLGVSARFPINR